MGRVGGRAVADRKKNGKKGRKKRIENTSSEIFPVRHRLRLTTCSAGW